MQMQQVPPAYERVVDNPDEKDREDTDLTKKEHAAELYDNVD